ncbi:LuxR family transcriptional regulator [Actinomycetospora sp. OC33-EN08]|uniref:LuxR family transcriptional regulator n=1 Tax=Actinomycetospora aurantiaca TaxID=3129233 RepID=A0ABU8MV56_9PSEU
MTAISLRRSASRLPSLVGRRAELDALATSRRGLVVLRGEVGSGRTLLLEHLARRKAAEGTLVLHVAARQCPGWDDYGVVGVLDAVRRRFEDLGADAGLADAIAVVDRQCTPAAYANPDGRASLLAHLCRLLRRVGEPESLVLVVDDADHLAGSTDSASWASTVGHLVIAAVRSDGAVDARGPQIAALADRVVDLGALGPAASATLIARRARRPVVPAVVETIVSGLGVLGGNPGALVGALEEMQRRHDLVDVHGRLCPSSADVTVTLPDDHPSVVATETLGAAACDVVVLARENPVALDDIPLLAGAARRPATECGQAADALVDLGVFTFDDAQFVLASPAVGAAVAERMGDHRARRLHAELVHVRTAVDVRGAAFAPAVLADHIVAAGDALNASPDLVEVLAEEARRVERRDPARAAARYRVARRHAAGGALRDELTSALQDLLLRTGAYAELAGLVEEVTRETAPTGDRRAELAALAGLATLHTGEAVDPEVRARLVVGDDAPCPLRCGERWTAGEDVSLNEFAAAFAALPAIGRPGRPSPASRPVAGVSEGRRFQLQEDLATRDLVPVFAALFPDSYRAPATGWAVSFHRLWVAHVEGRWTQVPGFASEVLAIGSGDPLTRQITRLLAAEVLACQGHEQAARRWLDAVPSDSPYPVYRAWVAAALTDGADSTDSGSPHRVLARQVIPVIRGATRYAPAWRLLLALGVLAVESDRADREAWIAELLGEVVALTPSGDEGLAGIYAGALEALLVGDASQATWAAESFYHHGRRMDVALLCLAIGLEVDDPAPFLLEGRAVAESAGAVRMITRFRAAMKRRGVTAPRASSSTGVSAAEHQLVELVREGRTNRQIATTLQLSEKTVENQLTRLFAKVGCRTRYGLATARLDTPPVDAAR